MTPRATGFAFRPAKPTVSSGVLAFVVVNDAGIPHALAVEGFKAGLPRIDPGKTARLSVNPPKGTQASYCPLMGHRERDMEGRLVAVLGS